MKNTERKNKVEKKQVPTELKFLVDKFEFAELKDFILTTETLDTPMLPLGLGAAAQHDFDMDKIKLFLPKFMPLSDDYCYELLEFINHWFLQEWLCCSVCADLMDKALLGGCGPQCRMYIVAELLLKFDDYLADPGLMTLNKILLGLAEPEEDDLLKVLLGGEFEL